MGGYDRQILTEASTVLNLQREIIMEKVPINSISCPDYLSERGGKKSLVNGLFRFDSSATMVALQSHCFMRMTSRTAITNFKKARWLKRHQETKPGRTRERTSEGMPGLL